MKGKVVNSRWRKFHSTHWHFHGWPISLKKSAVVNQHEAHLPCLTIMTSSKW